MEGKALSPEMKKSRELLKKIEKLKAELGDTEEAPLYICDMSDSEPIKITDYDDTERFYVRCPVCGKVMDSRSSMVRWNGPFRCPECGHAITFSL